VCCITDIFFTVSGGGAVCCIADIIFTASSGGEVCCITDAFSLQAVEEKCAALPIFLYSKQWKNSVLHYLSLYLQAVEEKCAALPTFFPPASSGGAVCCVTDNFFLLQAVEEKCAALPIFLYSKQWKNSVLHYRHFFTASSGGAVCCITYTFTCKQWRSSVLHYLHLYLQAVQEQCAALPAVCCMQVKNQILRHFDLSKNTSRIAAHGSRFSGTVNCCLPEAS
jgi:hypothetical protein